jgi:large subunit ribosomal protein L21
MYAIVDIAGQQFKVEKDQQIFIHRLEGKEGDKVSFDQVLLIDNDGKIAVGAPAIKDAAVTGKIIEHQRGDKVVIFKKKRRKGYQIRNGHRQDFTKIQIEAILEKGGSKVVKAEKAPAAKAEKAAPVKAEVKKPTAKTAEAKKPAAKTAEVKKPAAKSTAAKKTETKASTKTTAKKTTSAKPKAAAAPKTAAKKATPKKKADDK